MFFSTFRLRGLRTSWLILAIPTPILLMPWTEPAFADPRQVLPNTVLGACQVA
jgi:hypothetical protein